MEEMRSFGYICPHCGKAVLHQRSVFALSAAAAGWSVNADMRHWRRRRTV